MIDYKRDTMLKGCFDQLLPLDQCPFPLIEPTIKSVDVFDHEAVTPVWNVMAFGTAESPELNSRDPKYGHSDRWAHVKYVKRCGHEVIERITFFEEVQTIDHYGTIFTGESYSIESWEERIKFFQNCLLCDVCQASHHRWWIVQSGFWYRSDGDPVTTLEPHLDYSYNNWRDMISLENDFPGMEIGAIWRPKNQPRPNLYAINRNKTPGREAA